MKNDCAIVRDLLPLYVDGVASEASSELVKKHLADCDDCLGVFRTMSDEETVRNLTEEKNEIITRQARFFKRRSALAGGIIAAILLVPILICLIVNLASGSGLNWFFIVLASLMTAASLTVVPLMLPANKGLWTLASFTGSLLLLLGICCLYSGGRWFFVAGSSSVFGLALFFLPFAVYSKPLAGLLGNRKGLAVMTALTVFYAGMMTSIGCYIKNTDFFRVAGSISAPFILYAWLMFLTIRYAWKRGWLKAAICTALTGLCMFFAAPMISALLGAGMSIPGFEPFVWNNATLNGNILWIALLGSLLLAAVFTLIAILSWRKKK